MQDNYCLFESQLQLVCTEYKNLRIRDKGGQKYLVGTLDIHDIEGNFLDAFLVEIRYKKGFPQKFPELYEIGDSIPKDVDWHKYTNNSCCVTADPIESLYCKNGITVCDFIKKHAIPFLANQYYRKHFGKYKAEYAHGTDGLIQAYEEIMKTPDMHIWIEYLEYATGLKNPHIPRNSQCSCGSGKKYKHCHLKVLENLKAIGKDELIKHMKQINDELKQRQQR